MKLNDNPKAIALENRLRSCKNVITLGVRTNFSAYSRREAELIRSAKKIYYPSAFYADLFDAMGKATFPSYHTYKCVQDKIKQTAMLQLMDISHPRTRVYYGRRQKNSITDHFRFPFIAKIPRGSAMGRGVYLIRHQGELQDYLKITDVAYIQEFLPSDRDIRAIIIGDRIVHAYWRIAPENDFRCNLAIGGRIKLDAIPTPALDLALLTARSCRWDDVGVDIIQHNGIFYVLEANMKYGREGFRQAGINYNKLMEDMIANDEI